MIYICITARWHWAPLFMSDHESWFRVEAGNLDQRLTLKALQNINQTYAQRWIFSSADPKVSSAELMVLLICPSSVVCRRPSSVVVRRPSVNFCFKSLLLLQFLFDHSEFFTGETRHIVPPCNKAGISNFCLELQKLQKFQISWKRYSSFSSYSIILKFILEKLGI